MIFHGALHVHSTYSHDASLSLPELKALFLKRGLSFVLMTEHDEDLTNEGREAFYNECKALSDTTFLFIPGTEIDVSGAHLLVIGSLTVLAHPHRSNFSISEETLRRIDAVEIWNSQYDGSVVPRTGAVLFFEEIQNKKPHLRAVCGLDLHHAEHIRGPVLHVLSDALQVESILGAIKKGHVTLDGMPLDDIVRNSKQLSMRLKSFYAVFTITCFKKISALLHACGIRIPRGVRHVLRSGL